MGITAEHGQQDRRGHGLPYQPGRAAGVAGPLCSGGSGSGGGQGPQQPQGGATLSLIVYPPWPGQGWCGGPGRGRGGGREAVLRVLRRWGAGAVVPGSGVEGRAQRAGCHGRAGAGGGPLAPGARGEDKGLGAVTPQDGHYAPQDGQAMGRSVCSFPREPSQQVRHHKMPRLPHHPGRND